jgi:hypothetical protein
MKLVRADFTDLDLTGADLRGADLRGCNFTRANLTAVDLSDSILIGAIFVQANLTRALLLKAKMGGCNLHSATLKGASLAGAYLVKALLINTNLVGASLVNANLSYANLVGTHLKHTDVTGVDLTNVTWAKVKKPQPLTRSKKNKRPHYQAPQHVSLLTPVAKRTIAYLVNSTRKKKIPHTTNALKQDLPSASIRLYLHLKEGCLTSPQPNPYPTCSMIPTPNDKEELLVVANAINESLQALIAACIHAQDVLHTLPDFISTYHYTHKQGVPQDTYDGTPQCTYTPSYIVHPDYLLHFDAGLYDETLESWHESLGDVPPWALIHLNPQDNLM